MIMNELHTRIVRSLLVRTLYMVDGGELISPSVSKRISAVDYPIFVAVSGKLLSSMKLPSFSSRTH